MPDLSRRRALQMIGSMALVSGALYWVYQHWVSLLAGLILVPAGWFLTRK